MMQDIIEKQKSKLLILYILLYTSVDTILFGTNSSMAFLYVPRILGAVGIVFIPYISGGRFRYTHEKRKPRILGILLLLLTISNYLNYEGTSTFVSRIITILLAFVITENFEKEIFITVYDNFLYCVSIVAIVVEVIAYVARNVLLALPRGINIAGNTFVSLGIGGILPVDMRGSFIRSSGIFWEPGAFAIYLTLGMLFQLFALKKTNIKRFTIYIICLLITFSTTGYIASAVLALGYLFTKRSKRINKKLKVIIAVGALTVLVVAFFFDVSLLNDFVFAKLFNGTSGATTRYSSIFNAMRVAFDHPFFGVSGATAKYMQQYVSAVGNRFSNGGTTVTNTITTQYIKYGVIFGTLFLIGTFKFMKKLSTTTYECILLCLTITLCYFGENFFSFLPFVFVFYGFTNKKYENTGN